MKKNVFLSLFVLFSTVSILQAQTPEDALRFSWNTPGGTARYRAIGGAMGSLGGDITSLFVNPAGLGMYKNTELVLTPGFSFSNIKSNFRGTDASASKAAFDFGTSGFVWGWSQRYGKWRSKAASLAINRVANFNNTVYYKGQNDLSSFSETFAEEFANSGLPIDTRLYDAPLSLGTKLANYTYLIDTVTVNGNTEVVGLPQRDAILAGTSALLNQEKTIKTKGGITELSFGFAANMDDKLYLGVGLGLPIVNYERSSTITESDASGNTSNNFNSATYEDYYRLKGIGLNLKLGMILKPSEFLRLGLGIHTPTIYGLKQTNTGSIVADLENYFSQGQQIRKADQDSIYTQFGVGVPQYNLDLTTPWKFLVSASYVFREDQDVRRQRGFITADVEYVTYGSSRFSPGDDLIDQSYYDGVNEATKLTYKGAFNFKVGGELKFNTFMTRLGFGYYGSPYEEKTFKARHMTLSGGLGYRNKGYFIDLTYVHNLNRDINFPYRIGDKPNTYANLKEGLGNVALTVGFKLN